MQIGVKEFSAAFRQLSFVLESVVAVKDIVAGARNIHYTSRIFYCLPNSLRLVAELCI